ncbi:hypothetical protein BDV96DRAFT_94708 [Lophiotrema nucula]|uniref:Uncharacterized protein n=1 Tax=Lophiotrema nucula TaxID=690887 RepID=A0A6A5Z5M1_9PLEO|nr:hypothetical protein BDV96DRAFT_94708 [Lophiotrema nucula]
MMVIKPQVGDPLSADFATGWNKLPVELKMQILSYSLTIKKDFTVMPTPRMVYFTEYFRYLRMTTEIAEISKKVFYTENTFRCYYEHLRSPTKQYSFQYPNPTINSFIRHVEVTVSLRGPAKFLRKLADGDYGFAKLQTAKVTLDWKVSCINAPFKFERWSPELKREWGERIKFRCKGELCFANEDYVSWSPPDELRKAGGFFTDHIIFKGS